jgi:hypothetical protein
MNSSAVRTAKRTSSAGADSRGCSWMITAHKGIASGVLDRLEKKPRSFSSAPSMTATTRPGFNRFSLGRSRLSHSRSSQSKENSVHKICFIPDPTSPCRAMITACMPTLPRLFQFLLLGTEVGAHVKEDHAAELCAEVRFTPFWPGCRATPE